MPIIIEADLAPFAVIDAAKAAAMIEDAMADASRVAPCVTDEALTATKAAQFKSILRGAILRWNEAGTGALQGQTAGPFGQTIDTRQQRRGMFWPSELEALQKICSDGTTPGAFSVDTVSATGQGHSDTCNVQFGGDCSCGAVLTNLLYPIYGV